ncbi:hypothetical protein GCM10011415_05390 [Salipiger pallidus]|uniref:Glutamine amidotransferase domain-containing protein n=2 Tax=Salipiger pallidus TaxID=1775170 RepID=A0A8J2ZH72_9RHOB|nr:hypothetical protein GCM10011415_05390 [Salipiger pallidus]
MVAAAGHDWTRVLLHEGTPLPPLDGFDAVWVKSGSMDVWQEEAHPWLRAEKALIREAVVDRGMPYLGICLGHQLLASALGGEVLLGTPEVGVKTVTLHGSSPYMSDVPSPLPVLQWHAAEVIRPPEGAVVLASSPACSVEAMSWGDKALSVQFDLEAKKESLRHWTEPAPRNLDAEATNGRWRDGLEEALAQQLPGIHRSARQIYDNWCRQCGIPNEPPGTIK